MNDWKRPHLLARVLGGPRSHWRWVVEEGAGELLWALVQEDALGVEHPTGIFALGESVPLAGKVFAGVTPAALYEMSERALQVQEGLERLERLSHILQRVRARAYRLKRSDEYNDLRCAHAELVVVQGVLATSQMPSLAEMEQLEHEALAALKDLPQSP